MAPPSKKRKTSATEEISFDPAARAEYLTGFHKRKLARIKHAQEENAKKERQERIRARAELRKQRKEDLERHVNEVNRLVKQANGDASSDEGSSEGDNDSSTDGDAAPEVEPINQEDEYIDEDKYTTVTIESVGISKQGFEKSGGADSDEDDTENDGDGQVKKKKVWTKEKPKSTRPKKKKIKFRYETKAERKAERVKQGVKKKKLREARAARA